MKQATLLLLLLVLAPLALAQSPNGLGTNLTKLAVVNSDVVALTRSGDILLSQDGGDSVVMIHQTGNPDALRALAAAGDVVVAGGANGLLLRADFGVSNTNWTEVQGAIALAEGVQGLATDGAGNWVAVGDGVLLSDDDAQTWSDESGPVDLWDVTYNPAGPNWIAVGGVVFAPAAYTSADGITWSTSNVPVHTDLLRGVAADGFGNVLAVGELGTMMFSDDNGATFTLLASGVSQDLYAVLAVGENNWVVGGQERVLISVSAGTVSTLLEEDTEAGDILWLVDLNNQYLMAGIDYEPPDPPPADLPFFIAISRAGANLSVTATNVFVGYSYQLQETIDLTLEPQDWANHGTPEAGNDNILIWDDIPLTNGWRMYRIRVE
jgi:hypothetical protein